MKRSRRVKLVLLGTLSVGALTGCDSPPPPSGGSSVSVQTVYTNNFYVPGAGYYHAPFRNWYSHPYNYYDAQTQRYFYGGQWGTQPHQSITNISSPTTAAAAQQSTPTRTDVRRSGFGSSSSHHSTWS